LSQDPTKICRVLSLDGGGAKGFYTLGILREIEALTGKPLHTSFDLIFGTSTGAIIAALLARGDSVAEVHSLYARHVPTIMRANPVGRRTRALRELAGTVFDDQRSDVFKTNVGIVATNWRDERPLIFKTTSSQAHASASSFVPFFGCTVADAIIASCSAYPFFDRHKVNTSIGMLELADGGFCANNPSLYAIADAHLALGHDQGSIRLISLGVGSYPEPSLMRRAGRVLQNWPLLRHVPASDFIQKILGTNTNSMETLYAVLFQEVPAIRISDTYTEPELATDLMEHDLEKLERLTQKGRRSFAAHETRIRQFITRE
jgi:hypothetical protein